jgi:hypothetical protein
MNPCRRKNILAEKVQFRRGVIVVREARAEAFSTNRLEQVRKLNSTAQNWNSPTQDWDTATKEWNSPTQEWDILNQINSSPSQRWGPVGNSQ